jgi:pyridoxamine 5'-phosphate oxidase
MNNQELKALRQNYKKATFDMSQALENPIEQFKIWLREAVNSSVLEPNAFTLATVDINSLPNARVVLLKEIDYGFVFYTNYLSAKGKEIYENQKAAACFLWLELERQVRVQGVVEKIEEEQSDAYFYSRPLDSQIGAVVSDQSSELSSRKEIEEKFEYYRQNPTLIKRPAHWGGYRIIPETLEFWQGRESRLHDRVKYILQDQFLWVKKMLQP